MDSCPRLQVAASQIAEQRNAAVAQRIYTHSFCASDLFKAVGQNIGMGHPPSERPELCGRHTGVSLGKDQEQLVIPRAFDMEMNRDRLCVSRLLYLPWTWALDTVVSHRERRSVVECTRTIPEM